MDDIRAGSRLVQGALVWWLAGSIIFPCLSHFLAISKLLTFFPLGLPYGPWLICQMTPREYQPLDP
jgi:hypothetical protein